MVSDEGLKVVKYWEGRGVIQLLCQHFACTVEPRYFEVPREMKKKFEIAGLRNNRGSVKGKGKSEGIRSSFEIAETSN